MGTLWPQNWNKADVFACICVISSHTIKCNTCIESFYEGLHFFFLHWWAMSNIWGHYGLKALKFDDLTVLSAVWFTYLLQETYLWNHELTNIYRPSRLRWRSNWNLFTVACNCSFLVILFFFRTRDCHRKSPKLHHIQPPNSTQIWTLIRRCA